MIFPIRLAFALVTTVATMSAAGCADAPSEENADDRSEDVNVEGDQTLTKRPLITEEECKTQGTVVGDIGNGKVHKVGYRCANGKEPIASVKWGREGAVCCPN